MSHMVIYRSVDGKPGFQQTDDLVSAVEFVERLRNAEGVESARIYRLEQVNFRFQPYYQVHLDQNDAPSPPPLTIPSAAPASPAPGAVPAAPAAPVAPAPALVPSPPVAADPTPAPPVVPSAALAAAGDAVAPTAPETAPADPHVPSLGATPVPESAEGNGIRRGLFGR